MMVGAGNLAALDVLSNAAAVIAEGEVMQLAAMRNADISEDNYLRIIEAKTAALFRRRRSGRHSRQRVPNRN